MSIIDTTFDFTTDTPGYWDGYWERKGGIGAGGNDPDASSRTLQNYHRLLCSRKLPCGERMELCSGYGSNYLTWRGFRFGSDSIAVSFRYERNRELLTDVKRTVSDYRAFIENYVRASYTMGGMIIFPKHQNSINQLRGTNSLIRDRWDLTLECIRRHYAKEDSPLSDVMNRDDDSFELFVDFKGYVDYFFLQDCVTEDYSKVKIWLGKGDFTEEYPMPKTVKEYLEWIRIQLEFVKQRNSRIQTFSEKHWK